MGDERRRQDERRREVPGRDERAGLLDLLRRMVAPRQSAVLVMDRDGQVRKLRIEN
jgi:hypothetical protein